MIRRDKKKAGFGSVQHVLYDQKWADKQERGFVSWMNHVLCVDKQGMWPEAAGGK
jgi:hypothetical protein